MGYSTSREKAGIRTQQRVRSYQERKELGGTGRETAQKLKEKVEESSIGKKIEKEEGK